MLRFTDIHQKEFSHCVVLSNSLRCWQSALVNERVYGTTVRYHKDEVLKVMEVQDLNYFPMYSYLVFGLNKLVLQTT